MVGSREYSKRCYMCDGDDHLADDYAQLSKCKGYVTWAERLEQYCDWLEYKNKDRTEESTVEIEEAIDASKTGKGDRFWRRKINEIEKKYEEREKEAVKAEEELKIVQETLGKTKRKYEENLEKFTEISARDQENRKKVEENKRRNGRKSED